MIKKLYAILLLSISAAFTNGADLCVTVSGSGSQDGSDWDNAFSASVTYVRGNTYYFADGSYGVETFGIAASSDTLITIKKAIETDHVTDTGWSSTMGDGRAQWDRWTITTDDWLIDGQVGGGPYDWTFADNNGFYIYNTTASTKLISVTATTDNVTIKHTKLESDRAEVSSPVRGFNSTTATISNFTLSYCAFESVFGQVIYQGPSSDFMVEYCYFDYNNSTATWHSEMNAKAGDATDEVWRWNLFRRITGTAVFAGINTSAVNGIEIYGNIFQSCTTPIYYYDDGTNATSMDNAKVYNNTIINSYTRSMGAFKVEDTATNTNTSRNNLWHDNDANSFQVNYATNTHCYASDNIRSEAGDADMDANILSYHTSGQSASGSPFNSYTGDALVDDLRAVTDSGYDTGVELPGNDYDMFGNERGANGVWSRGAIQFVEIASLLTTPAASILQL